MNNGWVSIHRKILDWEWYQDPVVRSLFIHCLLKANHETKNYQGKEVPRGSFLTGREELANALGFSVQQIRTALRKLNSTNELTIKSTKKGSHIFITQYDYYQSDGGRSTNKSTNDATDNQPTTNHQSTTNNNEKNEKNENNKEKSAFDFDSFFEEFWETYPVKKDKKRAKQKLNTHVKTEAKANTVMEGLKMYIAYMNWLKKENKRDPKVFVPSYKHPSTWINGENWKDEFTVGFEKEMKRIKSNEIAREMEKKEAKRKEIENHFSAYRKACLDKIHGEGKWSIFEVFKDRETIKKIADSYAEKYPEKDKLLNNT